MLRRRWVSIARGDEPADLVLAGGNVLSVFTGEIFEADVAIADGHIVGVGRYSGPRSYDVAGKFLIPGFIDGHCHIESSKLSIDEFARAILPHGTTSVVVDPHELANVLGVAGIRYVLDASETVPLGVYVKMPSCVPASPFESSAGPIEACDFSELQEHPRLIGIAEMMNYPGAIAAQPDIMSKMASTGYRHIDGHAPGVTGNALNAYLVSGPSSDHECTTVAEALEKRRLGMWIMLREASMIRNLVDLLPLVDEYGTENCMFVTDDREAGTLLSEGHMNSMVRKAVAWGLTPGDAVKLATLNVARYHGLSRLGAIAPGYEADILILPDLHHFEPEAVFKGGALVAERGKAKSFPSTDLPDLVRRTVNVKPVQAADFAIPHTGSPRLRVLTLVRDQVVTRDSLVEPTVNNGKVVADGEKDLAKVAVVERHHATGQVGLGVVRGFGLKRGAFASTIAHDAHNIIVAGMDDEDMARCVAHLVTIGGGLVVVEGGEVLGDLPLEIAGLMSTRPAREVAGRLQALEACLEGLGVALDTPFMYLGFLALSVIPDLRITDQGIVDVRSFQLVPLGAQ